jgi:tRNA threonylcarbamoyladenosine biosynthesis protein TsaB
MALASELPCVGVTTLEAIAEAVAPGHRVGRVILVALDCRRSELFAQAFAADGEPLTAPASVPAGRLSDLLPAHPLVLAGDATPIALPALTAANRQVVVATAASRPDAAAVAAVAVRRWNGGGADLPFPSPLYLRPPAATLPVACGRRRH